MKHIRNYNTFKESKIDEGLLSNLFNKLKKKLSIGFTKKFVTGPKVDKVIEAYKKEIIAKIHSKKTEKLKEIGLLIKTKLDEVADDEDKKKEILSKIGEDPDISEKFEEYTQINKTAKKERELLKEKYALKFKEITKDEKEETIENYVNIKKIELEQELLQMESSALMNDTGLTEKDIKNSKELKQIIGTINNLLKKSKIAEDEQVKMIKSGNEEGKEVEKREFEVGTKYKYTNSAKEEVEITIKELDKNGDVSNATGSDGKEFNPYTDKIGDKIVETE